MPLHHLFVTFAPATAIVAVEEITSVVRQLYPRAVVASVDENLNVVVLCDPISGFWPPLVVHDEPHDCCLRTTVNALRALRSTEAVGLVVGGIWNECSEPSDVDRLVRANVTAASLLAAVDCYRDAMHGLRPFHSLLLDRTAASGDCGLPPMQGDDDRNEPVSFRVDTVRLDKSCKAFTSQQIGADVGNYIGELFQGYPSEMPWKVSLVFNNVTFVARHSGRKLLVGLQLHRCNLPRLGSEASVQAQLLKEHDRRRIGVRLYHGECILNDVRSFPHPTHFKNDIRRLKGLNSMDPCVGHYIAQIARIGANDVVLDPMAGSGSTLLEAVLRRIGHAVVQSLPFVHDPRRDDNNSCDDARGNDGDDRLPRLGGASNAAVGERERTTPPSPGRKRHRDARPEWLEPCVGLSGDLTNADCELQRENYKPSHVADAIAGHFDLMLPQKEALFETFLGDSAARQGCAAPLPERAETATRTWLPHTEQLSCAQWDATKLPLRPACVDVILCDMPFGRRCGSHAANAALYPAVLGEAHRVLRPGGTGRAVLLTTERALMDELLWPSLSSPPTAPGMSKSAAKRAARREQQQQQHRLAGVVETTIDDDNFGNAPPVKQQQQQQPQRMMPSHHHHHRDESTAVKEAYAPAAAYEELKASVALPNASLATAASSTTEDGSVVIGMIRIGRTNNDGDPGAIRRGCEGEVSADGRWRLMHDVVQLDMNGIRPYMFALEKL